MNTFELQNKTYTLPEGWHEVNLLLFEKLVEHSLNLPEYKSNIQFALEMLSILIGIDIEDLKRLSKESFDILSDSCEWVTKDIIPSNKKEIYVNGEVYLPIKDLNKITMGEQIDLEVLISNSNNVNTLTNILPILLRKAIPKEVNGESVLVPAEYNSVDYESTKELFKNHVMVADVITLKDSFFFGEKK